MSRCHLVLIILILLLVSHLSWGDIRRSKTFDYTPNHFIYPIPSKIPGLGSAFGIGATVNNIGGSDVDFTGVNLTGDFNVSVLSLLNIHLIKETFVLDAGFFNFDVASTTYDRGKDSKPDEFILPYVKGEGYFSQLTLLSFERVFELFVRMKSSRAKIKSILDSDGNEFKNIDSSVQTASSTDIGILIDLTDHRYDPRYGLRLEVLRKSPKNTNSDLSDYYVDDLNLSIYLPMGEQSTWAFNYFKSDAHIKREGITDIDQLRNTIGLSCASIPASSTTEKERCLAIENKRISKRKDFNVYGRSTPLGGSQRLRSFDNGRFTAGHARYIGSEFRWNFSDEQEPFNLFFMKGVRTGLQLAAFGGLGAIADNTSDLSYDLHSYGVGARVIFKGGTVFRADWANGNEGSRTILFVDYPWGLSPLDNSSD